MHGGSASKSQPASAMASSVDGIVFNFTSMFYFDCVDTHACGSTSSVSPDGSVVAVPTGFANVTVR